MRDGAAGLLKRRLTILASLCLVATVGLSVAAAGDGVLPGDVRITRAVQDVAFPGAGRLERFGYYLGTASGILTVAIPVILLLALTRRFAGIILIDGVLLLRGTNPWIKELIESPRPTADLVRVSADATGDPGSYGFPSGHVMGTVLLYGSLIYLAQRYVRPTWLRHVVQLAATLAIAVTALSRIYSGGHWPSDVIGGMLWGLSMLLLLIGSQQIWRGYVGRRSERTSEPRRGESPRQRGC